MVHWKDSLASAPETLSVAVTVTAYGLSASAPAEMVPLMVPVFGLMLKPVGKFVAVNVSGLSAESAASSGKYTVSPSALLALPGAASVTSGFTFQVKVWLALQLALVLSVAVTVTLYGPDSEVASSQTVPEMTPVVALIDRPAGRLVAV